MDNLNLLLEQEKKKEEIAKNMVYTEISGMYNCLRSIFPQEGTREFLDNETISVIEPMMGLSQDERFKPDQIAIIRQSNGNSISGQEAVSKDALKSFFRDVSRAADATDGMIKRYARNCGCGERETDFLKTIYTDKLRCIADGYSDARFMYKSPLVDNVNAIAPCLEPTLENGALKNKMDKWGKTFPIYDFMTESFKQKHILIDYWKEKEKAGNVLSPKKEEEYREKLYNKTLDVIRNYDKMMAVLEDEKLHDELLQDQVFTGGNEPFHMHPASNRGTRTAAASLEAYKKGLENGWAIDDIAYLAGFRNVIEHFEADAMGNNADKYHSYVKNDTPKYYNDSVKNYVKELRTAYNSMVSTPILTSDQRKDYLDRIETLLQKGKDQNLFLHKSGTPFPAADYVLDNLAGQRKIRDRLIEQEKMPAFYSAIKPKDVLGSIMVHVNARRTDKWWSSESDLHQNLRKAAEDLKTFKDENPPKEMNKEEFEIYALKYLSKLDKVTYNCDKYLDKKAKASSLGGIERLNGAELLNDYAKTEKVKLLEMAREKGMVIDGVDTFRKNLILGKLGRSNNKLIAMDHNALQGNEGMKKAINLAADVLAARLALDAGQTASKLVAERGFSAFRNSVAHSKEFQKVFLNFYKHDNLTGPKMSNALTGKKILTKIEKFRKEVDKQEIKQKKNPEKNIPSIKPAKKIYTPMM